MRNNNTTPLWILCAIAATALILCAGAVRAQGDTTTQTLSPMEEALLPDASGAPLPDLPAQPDLDGGAVEATATAQNLPLDLTLPVEDYMNETAGTGPSSAEDFRFNFRNVPLYTVLDYLSNEFGFIVLGDVNLSDRVDFVLSHQAVSRDEMMNLLNTMLYQKGYAAIWNDRTVRIVSKEKAAAMNIPVRVGKDPARIPHNDEIVTQIIPVRYANATQLIQNLDPLMPPESVASANQSSNAIILTGTQSSIRRMVEIVQALDTSISEIATIRVFMLKHADAVETARIVNELFAVRSTNRNTGGRGGGGSPAADFIARMRGESGDRGGAANRAGDGAAREAATQVVATSDQYANALIVRGPDEMIPTIEKLIEEMDIATDPITEVRVFSLRYAGAEETAAIIQQVFQQQTGRGGRQTFVGRGAATTGSARQTQANTVVVTADSRTNSILVSAVDYVMVQIAETIHHLDANPAKEQNVHVYTVKNASPEAVAAFLQQMVEQQRARNGGTGVRSTGTRTGTSTGYQPASGYTRTGTGTGTGASGARTGTGGSSRR